MKRKYWIQFVVGVLAVYGALMLVVKLYSLAGDGINNYVDGRSTDLVLHLRSEMCDDLRELHPDRVYLMRHGGCVVTPRDSK